MKVTTKYRIQSIGERIMTTIGNAIREVLRDGFTRVPNWFPTPTEGYKYVAIGALLYMKPKPRLRHILKYRFIPQW